MKLNQNSKIKKFVNKENIDKILSINSNFEKLGTWTIEKYASSGVVVKDFAEIGKISANDLLKHIEKLGFEVKFGNDTSSKNKEEINTENQKIVVLDVRPTIASGNDPFSEIMQAVKTLKEEEILQIINVFVPIPLINILKDQGFKSWTNTINEKEYHTFFTKVDLTKINEVENKKETLGNFDDKLKSYEKKVKEIEVRHLEMPEPMVTILEELENLPDDYILLVNHKKVPQFLLPELKARNYQWMSKEIEDGYLLFIVFK